MQSVLKRSRLEYGTCKHGMQVSPELPCPIEGTTRSHQRPKQTRPKQNPSKTQAIIEHATTARRGERQTPLTDHFLQCDSANPPRKAELPSSRQVLGITPHASTNNHQPRQDQNQDQDQTPGPCYGHAYLTIPKKQTSFSGRGRGRRKGMMHVGGVYIYRIGHCMLSFASQSPRLFHAMERSLDIDIILDNFLLLA